MTRTLIIESGQKPTEEQLKEVEEAKKSPINFDEDCGELSPAMMKAFKSAVVQRNRKKKAQEFEGRILFPQYPPNLKKSQIGNFRKQNEFSPKIKLGECSRKGIDIGQLKITGKPVKYIVLGICDQNTKRRKFAKQMERLKRM